MMIVSDVTDVQGHHNLTHATTNPPLVEPLLCTTINTIVPMIFGKVKAMRTKNVCCVLVTSHADRKYCGARKGSVKVKWTE